MWGQAAHELDDLELQMMMVAYVRRQRFESKILAMEVWSLLGQAMGKKSANQSRRVSSDELFSLGKELG